jgi:hypothetical protein
MRSEEQKLWRGSYRGIQYKVSLRAIGRDYTPASEGIWCFYIFLNEDKVKDFAPLWLEDEIYKYKPEAEGRITHEYYCEPFKSLEFHGGVTYYAKHGHTEGFRTVEIGCDYNHLWDMERGYGYRIEDILYDVRKCIDSVYENGLIAEQTK